ncbi:hypothetical protein BKL49_04145 [Rodentibacter myodis]|uniref:Uncharacterized protein n=1 Tax=Rodentibacter myodis TaxID=1907939 RepID=A0A1V3JRK3_9PAST|nr:hypothetical protein BKL49_04145 [Rodentibacter myodis]
MMKEGTNKCLFYLKCKNFKKNRDLVHKFEYWYLHKFFDKGIFNAPKTSAILIADIYFAFRVCLSRGTFFCLKIMRLNSFLKVLS